MATGVMLAVLLIIAVLAAIASFMLYTDNLTVARILRFMLGCSSSGAVDWQVIPVVALFGP
jgi:hypothetical protein